MRKFLLFLLMFFTSLLAKETLNFATSKNVGPLNPHLYSPNEMFAQDMVYEGLVYYGEDNIIKPSLATSWEISDDGKNYTFHLRNGVKFSDGEIFNANAVKANFDAIMANKKRHSWAEFTQQFDHLEVIDDYTIKIFLKNVYEPTLRELAMIRPYRFISPKAMIDSNTKDGIKAPIGTGKWKLVDTKLGEYDKFEKNESYWGEKPYIDEIVAKVIPDPNTKVIAMRSNEVDFIYGNGQIPLDAFKDFEKSDFKTMISEPLNTFLIAMNSNKFPTSDLSVRKAINMSLNKDEIIKYIFFNTQPKADFLFSSSVKYANLDAKPYKFDLKEAENILESDGWKLNKNGVREKNGKELKIELSYIGSNAVQKAIGEILQANLKKIGVILTLNANENTMFYKRQKDGNFDLIYNDTWGAPYEPEIFLASMRLPSHADYMAQLGLKNKKEIDEKISKLLIMHDESKKERLIKEILLYLHDEAVYLPIAYDTNKVVANPNLEGIKTSIIKQKVPFDSLKFKK